MLNVIGGKSYAHAHAHNACACVRLCVVTRCSNDRQLTNNFTKERIFVKGILREGLLIRDVVINNEKKEVEVGNVTVTEKIPIVLMNGKTEFFKPNLVSGVRNVNQEM